MENQNLVLTKKSIARHTKRLIKELEKLNQNIKLSEAQQIMSRILGCNNYNELNKILEQYETKEEVGTLSEKQNKNLDMNDAFKTLDALMLKMPKETTGVVMSHQWIKDLIMESIHILRENFTEIEISATKELVKDDECFQVDFYNNKILVKQYHFNYFVEDFFIIMDQIQESEISKGEEISIKKNLIKKYYKKNEMYSYIVTNKKILHIDKYIHLNEFRGDLNNINVVYSSNSKLKEQALFSISEQYMKKYNPITALLINNLEKGKYDLSKSCEGQFYEFIMLPSILWERLNQLKTRKVKFFINIPINIELLEELSLTGHNVLTIINKEDYEINLNILARFILSDKHEDIFNTIYIVEEIRDQNYMISLDMKKLYQEVKNEPAIWNKEKNAIMEKMQTLSLEQIDKSMFASFIRKFIEKEIAASSVDEKIKKKLVNRFMDH